MGSNIVCPSFIDVCSNHDLQALHGYKKKLYIYGKFMVKAKKGHDFDSVSDFSIFVPKTK